DREVVADRRADRDKAADLGTQLVAHAAGARARAVAAEADGGLARDAEHALVPAETGVQVIEIVLADVEAAVADGGVGGGERWRGKGDQGGGRRESDKRLHGEEFLYGSYE